MHRIPLLIGLTALAAAAFAEPPAPTATQPSHDDIAGKPSMVVKDASRDLKRSLVVATFEHPMVEGKSMVWCSTMQLAWNELGGVMGAPIKAGDAGGAGGAMIAD